MAARVDQSKEKLDDEREREFAGLSLSMMMMKHQLESNSLYKPEDEPSVGSEIGDDRRMLLLESSTLHVNVELDGQHQGVGIRGDSDGMIKGVNLSGTKQA
ncbi:uncharacterized protein PGTG_15694 [Puccinia graminis f. sp. tritici CRL 75-36-700-3]|uniref:Uncharacterized protein n=1 Tax=Puccinia graminis f. sp. tritici (strain CRL 75-36-700-3 / race SCCL) TaxID=418459 RepID=E3KZ20_PUCGT|nr:uncharacterized protein PGTG_15694 [Puccinia graminis f. sp. tritici CRL 75-36-700-3]EFP89545.1 hypothetical protein PGTG_15694 [Puccinia graminis f. sp. tritici CRL 75-36-700-3]